MYKRQQPKTVQFSHLSEDHKAEFLQFLIQNNICFQEGKQNCTAKLSIKPEKNKIVKSNLNIKPKIVQKHKQNIANSSSNRNSVIKKSAVKGAPEKKQTNQTEKKISQKIPLSEIKCNSQIRQTSQQIKRLKTPVKTQKHNSNISSFSQKNKNQTNHKVNQFTPKTRRALSTNLKQNSSVKVKQALITKKIQKQINNSISIDYSKDKISESCQDLRRKKGELKYQNFICISSQGRPIKWPLNVVERIIQEIYDQMFLRNTQCLQNKNISSAMKSITSQSFGQTIQNHFLKRFKGSKLACTNLHNFLHSLSHHIEKQSCPKMLQTFQRFLIGHLHHEDLLYYLFARNILKKEMKIAEKLRESSKAQGIYFTQGIKLKDIRKYLKAIIGKDNELLNEYRELILQNSYGEKIPVYEFLRILVNDYNEKRIESIEDHEETITQPLFDRQSYDNNTNDELTFGEQNQEQHAKESSFWMTQSYLTTKDSLFEIIMQKMQKKASQLIQILASDSVKGKVELGRLKYLLLRKTEALVKSVFEMNKMKWFKQLGITNPGQIDIDLVESAQMRLKNLKQNPTGRQIGQFCKNLLTLKPLINQLQIAVTQCS